MTGSSARRAEEALAARGVGVGDYLAHLGLDGPRPPSPGALAELQVGHLERVAFENLEIQRGRPTTVDPGESAERIVRRRRGGYCFHLNGAFALLLTALGYEVSSRRGTVQASLDAPQGQALNHLVLLVHGLPTAANAEGTWWTEVGLGDGPSHPVALTAGRGEDDPFGYRLEPSPVFTGGWRLLQGDGGSVGAVDVDAVAPAEGEIAAAHRQLSTSPDSGFVRTATAQRRRDGGVDLLRARTLSRVERGGTQKRVLSGEAEWFAVVADVFGLDLSDADAAERRALWERVAAQHAAHAATGAR